MALLHGDTATVKRLYRDPEGEGKMKLRPENPAYEEIVVESGDVVIQGRVRGLLRSLSG